MGYWFFEVERQERYSWAIRQTCFQVVLVVVFSFISILISIKVGLTYSIYCCFLLFFFLGLFLFMCVCVYVALYMWLQVPFQVRSPRFYEIRLIENCEMSPMSAEIKLSSSSRAIWAFNHLNFPIIIFLMIEMLIGMMLFFNFHFSND